MTLLLVYPVSALPFVSAFAVVQGIGLGAYLSAVLKVTSPSRTAALAALAFPAAHVTLIYGHLSFLTAGLLGWSLVLLPRSPAISGILLGLLTFKPQLGLLVPVALLAGRRWRVFGWAVLSALVFAGLATWSFGPQGWAGFFATTSTARAITEAGLAHAQSVFGAVRLLGGSLGAAYALHGLVGVLAFAGVAWIWSRPVPLDLQCAALVCGTLLTTPYLYDYDLTGLALAIAFLVRHGTRNGWFAWERSALAASVLLMFLGRSLSRMTHMELGPVVMLLLLGIALRRGASVHPEPRPLAASVPI